MKKKLSFKCPEVDMQYSRHLDCLAQTHEWESNDAYWNWIVGNVITLPSPTLIAEYIRQLCIHLPELKAKGIWK